MLNRRGITFEAIYLGDEVSRTNAIDAAGNPVRERTALTASSTRELSGGIAGASSAPNEGCSAPALSKQLVTHGADFQQGTRERNAHGGTDASADRLTSGRSHTRNLT